MKTKKTNKLKLHEGGRDEFEGTDEFINKVEEIRKDLTEKYSQKLSNERNWVRRFSIKVKLEVEIRKRIRALSSLKNLHAINT
jgi:type III secretory pathway component EscV